MGLAAGTIFFIAVSQDLKYVCTTGSLPARSFCVLVNRAPLLALLGLLFLLLRWRVRRALAAAEQNKRSDPMKWKC